MKIALCGSVPPETAVFTRVYDAYAQTTVICDVLARMAQFRDLPDLARTGAICWQFTGLGKDRSKPILKFKDVGIVG